MIVRGTRPLALRVVPALCVKKPEVPPFLATSKWRHSLWCTMSEKSGAKSGKKPGTFKKGGDPRQGRGPKPGTGGRPPDEFRQLMREMVNRKKALGFLERCIDGEFGPRFHVQAVQYATDRAYGKASQPVEMSGRLEGGVLRVPGVMDPDTWAKMAAEQQDGHRTEGEG
jgi:hypothetical protein